LNLISAGTIARLAALDLTNS